MSTLTRKKKNGIIILILRYTAMNNSTKLEVSLFKTALAYVGVDVDDEEVECMLANMIYKVKTHSVHIETRKKVCYAR